MSKKRYCQNCNNLIEEGKEIKVHKGTNYRSSRYSSYPRDIMFITSAQNAFNSSKKKLGQETKEFENKLV